MKIAIGADHAGYEMKEKVKKYLEEFGHEVVDFGTEGKESVDYPNFALNVAHAVADGEADRGIAVCYTGNGMTIATNKVKGIRATLCINKEMAHYARYHNDSNVMTLSQHFTDEDELKEIVKTWLKTEFEGGRHTRRLDIIKKAEEDQCK